MGAEGELQRITKSADGARAERVRHHDPPTLSPKGKRLEAHQQIKRVSIQADRPCGISDISLQSLVANVRCQESIDDSLVLPRRPAHHREEGR